MLSRKALSAHEISQKLRKKEYPESEIRECVDKLIRLKLLDDILVAGSTGKKYALKGNYFIRQKLKSKGIADDTATDSIAGLEDEQVRALAAYEIINRKLRETDPLKRKEKLYRRMASAGFSPSTIMKILKNPDIDGN